MKVLVDTCVVLDVLTKREPFYEDSKRIFTNIAQGKMFGFVTACSINDIYYLLNKHVHNASESKNIISTLITLFDVLDVNGEDIGNALASNVTDFEDATIVESALRHHIDAIVTRNAKDFKAAPINVFDPSELM